MFFFCYVSVFALNLMPKSRTGQLVHHNFYSLSYDKYYRQAEWVYYVLTPELISGPAQRKNNFRPDPHLTIDPVQANDFSGSGYDRGHLVPAGDMKYSDQSMSETFFMSNMSPQVPKFNQGIWGRLENYVRNWVLKRNCDCVVITGPVLQPFLPVIKGKNIAIPEYYFKIVVDYASNPVQVKAYLMPNKESKDPVEFYQVSINYIEKISKNDFFPELPDDEEEALESLVN